MNAQLFVAWRPQGIATTILRGSPRGRSYMVVAICFLLILPTTPHDLLKDALADVESAIRFHIETFGPEAFEDESPSHSM